MILDDDVDARYQYGACRAMAIALHDATGWPLVVVSDFDDGDEIADDQRCAGQITAARMSPSALHALVLRPDGMLVDSRGAHDPVGVVESYDAAADDGRCVLRYAKREDLLEEHDQTSAASETVEGARRHAAMVLQHIAF